MNKSDAVVYALRNIKPPLDAAGRIINDGDWVVRAITMGQVAGLQFGRAFPMTDLTDSQKAPKRHSWGNNGNSLKITVFGIQSDDLAYGRGSMMRGTISHAFRVMIVDELQIPEAIRVGLSGTRQELEARYKAKARVDVD